MSRDQRLITSVSEDEKQAFRMEAARRGLTMSELLREAALGMIEEERETGKSTTAKTTNVDPRAATASQTD